MLVSVLWLWRKVYVNIRKQKLEKCDTHDKRVRLITFDTLITHGISILVDYSTKCEEGGLVEFMVSPVDTMAQIS